MAVAAVILALFPVFPAAMLAALVLGLGYGMYSGSRPGTGDTGAADAPSTGGATSA